MINSVRLHTPQPIPQKSRPAEQKPVHAPVPEVQFGAAKSSSLLLPLLAMVGLAGCNNTFSPTASTPPSSQVSVIQTTPNGGVVVNGTGTVKKTPDSFSFNACLKEESTNYDEVMTNLSTRGEALSKALKALDLQLENNASISISPKYEWANGKSTMIGYDGSYSIHLKGNIAKDANAEAQFKKDASKITKVLAEQSATLDGPYFSLTDNEQAQQEALEKAIHESVAKARTVAKTMGFDVNEKTPFSVTIGQSANYENMPRYAVAAASAFDGGRGGSSGIAEEAFTLRQIEVQSPQVVIRFNIEDAPAPAPQK